MLPLEVTHKFLFYCVSIGTSIGATLGVIVCFIFYGVSTSTSLGDTLGSIPGLFFMFVPLELVPGVSVFL